MDNCSMLQRKLYEDNWSIVNIDVVFEDGNNVEYGKIAIIHAATANLNAHLDEQTSILMASLFLVKTRK